MKLPTAASYTTSSTTGAVQVERRMADLPSWLIQGHSRPGAGQNTARIPELMRHHMERSYCINKYLKYLLILVMYGSKSKESEHAL